MNNYAMIGINTKTDEQDKIHVRRVLIAYSQRPTVDEFGVKYFHNTRIVDVDPYFKDRTKSHQYKFEDDGYILLKANNEWSYAYKTLMPTMYSKRKYHINPTSGEEIWDYSGDKPELTGQVRFKAKNDEEAIKIFHERKELR